MRRWQRGYHWDGTPAYRWQCICLYQEWDGEPAWPILLRREGLLGAYLERYGNPPAETDPLPPDFAIQLRLL